MRGFASLLGVLAATPAFGQDVPAAAKGETSRRSSGLTIAALKEAIEGAPLDTTLRLQLARAYLDDGNSFWALRTVAAAAALHPDDCDLLAWQAHIQLRQGMVEQARELLQTPCRAEPPDEPRRALLFAMVEQAAGADAAAQAHLDLAQAARLAFPEDRDAIAALRVRLRPAFGAPLSGRADLAVGATSNARAGSPVDPQSRGSDARSLAVQAAGFVRFVSPRPSWARLSLEAQARALGYEAQAGKDYSYLMVDGRPGLLLDLRGKPLLLGYRYESLLLAGGDRYDDGPLWFFDAHRGEWELELVPALTVFGGAGRRGFREIGRTRFEVDGGVGGSVSFGPQLQLMAALSGRYHDANNAAYDLRGVSLLLSAERRFARGASARAGILASADDYPRSTGYFDPNAADSKRRDLVLRLSLSLFAPPVHHVKLGVTYELAVRDSTAAPYDYTDHRLLAKMVWTFSADPWLPRAAAPAGHVPIDYQLGTVELTERVQDLLRQGEAAQRSSSCRE